MKKKKSFMLLGSLILYFCLSGVLALNTNQGNLSLFFNPQGLIINSPQNTTYTFLSGENHSLLINVSSGFLFDSLDYRVKDIKNNVEREGSLLNAGGNSYSISGYFDVYRASNLLTVFVEDVNGQIHNKSVVFFVKFPNSAPVIQNLSNNIYVCENSYLSHFFNSYDADEDNLEVDISPKYPFYVHSYMYLGSTILVSEIYSGILRKNKIGLYEETVSVSDGQYSDYKKVNITVIEVNNAPVVQNIGVQTIWLVGENSTLNKTILVTDTEDGDQDSGKLNFSLIFQGENLFNLTQNSSLLYFKATPDDLGVHNISFCAKDRGISSIHPNISLCSQNGSSLTSCINFSLTITNENRAPTITSYSPTNLAQLINETSSINFSITKYDPDETLPDSYWYLDDTLIYYFPESLQDSFIYTFDCDLVGNHKLKVDITDGALNDSLSWSINVSLSGCSVVAPSGGGGGGGKTCESKIACNEWAICQNSEKSLTNGSLSGSDYRTIKDLCDYNGFNNLNCGFQIRTCIDLNNCTKLSSKNETIRVCNYNTEPSCFDKIKNCHDGMCELLVDCGGSCQACPTCSDNILNQNEEKIDCGGPCPIDCQVESPKSPLPSPKNYIALIIILLLIIVMIYIYVRIYLIKKEKKRLMQKYFKDKND
jgi:hypothetical protein